MTPFIIKVPTNDAKYLALRSFSDLTVVAYGTDPSVVIAEARKAGIKDPVIFPVLKPGQKYIY